MISHIRKLTLAVVLGMAVQGTTFAEPSARQALIRELPQMKLENAAFSDAIDFLADATGANIHVNWKAVELLGITKDSPISCKLRNVTLKKALALIVNEVGKGNQLTFFTDQGVIEITTRELADQKLYTAIYPVDDILLEIPDFEGPELSLGGGGGGGSSGSGAGDIFKGGGASEDEEKSKTKTERAEELVEMIKETIRPEVWRDNGGTASIKYFRGNLIVTAPRSVHESLDGPIGE